MNLIKALKSLDPSNADHWTADGAPVVAVVAELIKDKKLTRAQITEAAPSFTRENPTLPGDTVDVSSLPSLDSLPPEEQAQVNAILDDETPFNQPPADEQDDAEGIPPTELQLAQAEVARLTAKVTEKNNAIEAAKKEATAAVEELVRAEERVQALTPNNTHQSAIQSYIAAQQEQRARRAEQRNAMFAGLDPKSLDPRSPIDQAFARKTARGTARPVRPVTQ